jgi:hypothetical protein
VKNALCLYEALIEETEAGNQVPIRDANGTVSPYRPFLWAPSDSPPWRP